MKRSLLILTGHSKGLGRAILNTYLQKDNYKIIAISRTKLGLAHPNLLEISIDLGDLDTLENKLPEIFPPGDYEEVVLINNAGWIGEVKPVGAFQAKQMRTQVNVNLLAPMYLTNAFVAAYKDSNAKKIICNISSGASSRPVAGWAGYCSTKAAIAMFTQVAEKEYENSQFRFFSLAPGIVDTEMQDEIRKAEESDFPDLARFKKYKAAGELSSPEEVAAKIFYLLDHAEDFEGVIQDVRAFDLP
ncbi:SDR family NAD(P)-dependent oxidoreductase [Algoriphagus sp. NG3]|uniref:SDR family NAD(P)-dependent oxidoreductase n=1 Tax=Algoriphagus sp. NG3 TaxID=3097546 RepID=UPI002A810C62|nr:SDR family NAD(P)-dependent oxidoreductase [Algoriphagus sp. NG3]WPR75746.1 SDR family NAD(P)-dependent oxidoreductase [Algoriphagus sp. NG3]